MFEGVLRFTPRTNWSVVFLNKNCEPFYLALHGANPKLPESEELQIRSVTNPKTHAVFATIQVAAGTSTFLSLA